MVAQLNRDFIKARPGKVWPRLLAYFVFEGRPLTTRGRWINPIVFSLCNLWARLPFQKRDPCPIFILGVGRSGTTILGSILALHKDVGYLNEPKALWQAALGDDDIIGSYSSVSGRYRMTADDLTPAKVQLMQRFYSAFLTLSGSRRIVDKYPEMIFRLGLIDAMFPGPVKIALVRNGVDLCQSVQRWSQNNSSKNGAHRDDWWGRDRRKWHLLVDDVVSHDPIFTHDLSTIRAFTRQTDMAAVEWIASMRKLQSMQASNCRNLIIVRYEDLIHEPRATVSGILEFCGLDQDKTVLDFAGSVLERKTRHGCLDLDPAIQPAFDATMQALGYQQRQAA